MSLLREAEKCIANQKAHAAFNAFITPLRSSGPWLEQVKDADRRREQGLSIWKSVRSKQHMILYTNCFLPRQVPIEFGRPLDLR